MKSIASHISTLCVYMYTIFVYIIADCHQHFVFTSRPGQLYIHRYSMAEPTILYNYGFAKDAILNLGRANGILMFV